MSKNMKFYLIGVLLLVLMSALAWIWPDFFPAQSAVNLVSRPQTHSVETVDTTLNDVDLARGSSVAQEIASVETLVGGLQKRLELEPDDMQGWALLGKSYHHMQRWEEASHAFDQAKLLGYLGELPLAMSPKTVPRSLFQPAENYELLFKGMSRAKGDNSQQTVEHPPGVEQKVD